MVVRQLRVSPAVVGRWQGHLRECCCHPSAWLFARACCLCSFSSEDVLVSPLDSPLGLGRYGGSSSRHVPAYWGKLAFTQLSTRGKDPS